MNEGTITVTVYPPFASPLQMKLIETIDQVGIVQFFVIGKYLGENIETGGYYWIGDSPKNPLFKKSIPQEAVDEIFSLYEKFDCPENSEFEVMYLDTVSYKFEYAEGNNVAIYKWTRPSVFKELMKIIDTIAWYMRVGLPR